MPEPTNISLKENVKKFANPGDFWRHHRNVLGTSHLARDRLHLNHSGMKGFRRSVCHIVLLQA